jgi:pimeloyl-ACP methyl ester carboxylesterase
MGHGLMAAAGIGLFSLCCLWRSKPSWFLIAEEDRMINPKTQHFMAERMAAKVQAHRVDHTPLFTAPEVVIDIIHEAARETLTC